VQPVSAKPAKVEQAKAKNVIDEEKVSRFIHVYVTEIMVRRLSTRVA
jgi:hypothetical protein